MAGFLRSWGRFFVFDGFLEEIKKTGEQRQLLRDLMMKMTDPPQSATGTVERGVQEIAVEGTAGVVVRCTQEYTEK